MREPGDQNIHQTSEDMTRKYSFSVLTTASRVVLFGLFIQMLWLSSRAATIWTGPDVTWTKSSSTPSDTIIPGKVVFRRGANNVLYNTAAGETSAGSTSPKDTMWAFGNIANATTLTYHPLAFYRNGNLAGRILNQPMVVHLIAEDIYFSITFTVWGQHLNGGVSYTRSTAPAAVPPTVSIASPLDGATFTAPASFDLTASASVSGGTVSKVEYFANGASLGSATSDPFRVTANIADPGSYAITAVATANGLSTTSSAIHVTVNPAAVPPTVSISSPSDGATFTAPASFDLTASASVSGGTVSKVEYFANGASLGSA
ncbi:MAG TPA: Ig-like domain-containing protein, partial [Verrucomicrobiae bacterium]|nr:Ig-like domain-containing protein [Verrucomicrobiae bacterium]